MLWVAFVADIVAVLVLVVSWRSGRAIASSSKAVRRHLDRQLTPNPDRVSNATAAPAGTMDPSMRRAIDTLKVVSDLERCASVAEASARLEAAKASADEPHAGNTRSSITLASVAVGAVALAIVPLVLLNIEIVRARTDIGFAGHEIVANARTAQALGPCSEPLNPHPNELDLTIGRADPVGGSIDLTAALCVTQDTLLHLESVPLVGPRTPLPIIRPLPPSFASVGFTLAYQGTLPAQDLSRFVSVREVLAALPPSRDITQRKPVLLGTFPLSVLGNARRFPLDNYSAHGYWTLQLSMNAEVTNNPPQDGLTFLPFTLRFLSASPTFTWRADGQGSTTTFMYTTVEARRGTSTSIFSLLLTTLPILLFVGVLTAIPKRQRQDEPSPGPTAELFVG